MRTDYQVHRLDGYTDGKPSWVKVSSQWSRERAEAKLGELQRLYPASKFRVRKVNRRK